MGRSGLIKKKASFDYFPIQLFEFLSEAWQFLRFYSLISPLSPYLVLPPPSSSKIINLLTPFPNLVYVIYERPLLGVCKPPNKTKSSLLLVFVVLCWNTEGSSLSSDERLLYKWDMVTYLSGAICKMNFFVTLATFSSYTTN